MAIRRAARRKHSLTPTKAQQPTASGSAPSSAVVLPAAPSIAAAEQDPEVLLRRARRAAFAGDDAAALPLYVQAISRGCAAPMAFNDLGTLLAKRGQLPPAVVQFEIALALEPRSAEFRRNLCTGLDAMAQAAWAANRLPDAVAAYTRLAQLDDESALSQTKVAMAFRAARSPALALPFLRRAAELEPESAQAHANLGTILYELNQREAEPELVRAIELDPSHIDAHVNLAAVCNRLGQLTRAADLARRALQLAPDHADAHAALAGLLREQGEVGASIEHYRRAIGLRPDSALIFSNYLLTRHGDPTADGDDLLVDHRAWAARFVSAVDFGAAGTGRSGGAPHSTVQRQPDRRLRVGYVSGDFRQHAVASFVEPIIAAHNRDQVEVICYSDSTPDLVTTRIREVARPDVWRDVRDLSDQALAKQITDDQIDVLVDLAGHTAGNRLLTFARRPAPVQVTYCGYPGTTGLSEIGWRLTDDIADPRGAADRQHAEQLWRLPQGFLCFQPDPALGPPSAAPCSVNGSAVTFGSFNNLSKLGDDVLSTWARILTAVEGSRLLLKARALTDEEPRERLRRTFERHGIAPERLLFAPYAATTQDHLAVYGRVDLALDPFPYNGATTTCEALWMGVPVLTLAGQAHAGRVGASLLSRVGCPELVAGTADLYVQAAVALAADRERLARYRAELRPRMLASPLTNPTLIAADIEAAYREMWRQFCATPTAGDRA